MNFNIFWVFRKKREFRYEDFVGIWGGGSLQNWASIVLGVISMHSMVFS